MHRRKFMTSAAGLLVLAADACWPRVPEPGDMIDGDLPGLGRRLYRGADLAFGTVVTIQVVHHDERTARAAIKDAFAQAHRIDRLLSIYREESQIGKLNRSGRLDAPDPHLLKVIRAAQRLSQFTQGAFDMTVQPLWLASTGKMDRTAAHALVDWRNVLVEEHTIRLQRSGMAITLNGIAQGYATDLAMAAIRSHGITDALIDIGEFSADGRPSVERSWQVGVADPRARQHMLRTVRLERRSLATSGDYETSFSPDFSRHHIVDPLTGDSPLELASVVVAAPTAMVADGLSTALMVTGMSKGLDLVGRLPGVDALFVDKQGGQRWSTDFPFA